MLRSRLFGTVMACALAVVMGWGGDVARADLAGEFAGFDSIEHVGTSGRESSYWADSAGGTVLPTDMPTLSDELVNYPGVGKVPSPGGLAGYMFDEGAMGVKLEGGNLVVKVATSMDPTQGYWYGGVIYGTGDVFLTVKDTAGIRDYALMNTWARRYGTARTLNGGYYDVAQEFHTGEASGVNLEGHLVGIRSVDDVLLSGGKGAYSPYILPEGVDFRVFAKGGTDLGSANLTHTTTTDDGMYGPQTWHVQTWTVPVAMVSADAGFTVGLHQAASCANDQLGMVTNVGHPVPVPPAVALGMIGMGLVVVTKKARRLVRPLSRSA